MGVDGNKDMVHRLALGVLASDRVAVGEVAEIGGEQAATFQENFPRGQNGFDVHQFAIHQPPAIDGFPVAADEQFFLGGDGERLLLKERNAVGHLFGVERVSGAAGLLDHEITVLNAVNRQGHPGFEKTVFAVEHNHHAGLVSVGSGEVVAGPLQGMEGIHRGLVGREQVVGFEMEAEAFRNGIAFAPSGAHDETAFFLFAGFQEIGGNLVVSVIVFVFPNPTEVIEHIEPGPCLAIL